MNYTTTFPQVGKGERFVSWTYEKCHVGPIYVETEEEVRAIFDLVEEKVNERQAKLKRKEMTGKVRNFQSHKFYRIVFSKNKLF